MSVLGIPVAAYVSVSEASTSLKLPVTSRLYAASSSVLASAIADTRVGASFTLATVIVNVCVDVSPEASAAVITTL